MLHLMELGRDWTGTLRFREMSSRQLKQFTPKVSKEFVAEKTPGR